MGLQCSKERAQLRQRHCDHKGICYYGGTAERFGYRGTMRPEYILDEPGTTLNTLPTARISPLSMLGNTALFWKPESREMAHTPRSHTYQVMEL